MNRIVGIILLLSILAWALRPAARISGDATIGFVGMLKGGAESTASVATADLGARSWTQEAHDAGHRNSGGTVFGGLRLIRETPIPTLDVGRPRDNPIRTPRLGGRGREMPARPPRGGRSRLIGFQTTPLRGREVRGIPSDESSVGSDFANLVADERFIYAKLSSADKDNFKFTSSGDYLATYQDWHFRNYGVYPALWGPSNDYYVKNTPIRRLAWSGLAQTKALFSDSHTGPATLCAYGDWLAYSGNLGFTVADLDAMGSVRLTVRHISDEKERWFANDSVVPNGRAFVKLLADVGVAADRGPDHQDRLFYAVDYHIFNNPEIPPLYRNGIYCWRLANDRSGDQTGKEDWFVPCRFVSHSTPSTITFKDIIASHGLVITLESPFDVDWSYATHIATRITARRQVDGTKVWELPDVEKMDAVVSNVLIVTTESGFVKGIDVATGRIEWSIPPLPIKLSVLVGCEDSRTFLANGSDGRCYLFKSASGQCMGSVLNEPLNHPIVVGNRVIDWHSYGANSSVNRPNALRIYEASAPLGPAPTQTGERYTPMWVPSTVYARLGHPFTVTSVVAGTGLRFQWEVKRAGADSFVPIPGANSASYTAPIARTQDDGARYRLSVTDSRNMTVNGHEIPIVVYAPPGVASPMDMKVVANRQVVLSASVSGFPAPTVTWYVQHKFDRFPTLLGEGRVTYKMSDRDAGTKLIPVAKNTWGTHRGSPVKLY